MRFVLPFLMLFVTGGVFHPAGAQESDPATLNPRDGIKPVSPFAPGGHPSLGLGKPLVLPSVLLLPHGIPNPHQEREPLPIFDHEGNRILRFQIERRVDRGLSGLLWGSVIGSAVGGVLLNALFSGRMKCGSDWSGDLCSPQEKSLRERVPEWGMLLGLVGGGYLGFRWDRKTWDQAVRDIRRERKAGIGSGGPGMPDDGGDGS